MSFPFLVVRLGSKQLFKLASKLLCSVDFVSVMSGDYLVLPPIFILFCLFSQMSQLSWLLCFGLASIIVGGLSYSVTCYYVLGVK